MRPPEPSQVTPADGGGPAVGMLFQTPVWRLVTGILGQTALLTALLLFFGWALLGLRAAVHR